MKRKILVYGLGLMIATAIITLKIKPVYAITQDELQRLYEERCAELGIDPSKGDSTGGTANDNFTNEDLNKIEEYNKNQTNTNTQPQEVKKPTEFTVEQCNKIGWVIKNGNIRKGASTEYEVIGSVKENDEITITGIASTGWYRIKTENNPEAFVSDTLITLENPNEPVVEEPTETVKEEPTTTEEITTEEVITEEETTEEPTIEPLHSQDFNFKEVATEENIEAKENELTPKKILENTFLIIFIIAIIVGFVVVPLIKIKKK